MLRRAFHFESEHPPAQCAMALEKLASLRDKFLLADEIQVEVRSAEADYPFTITLAGSKPRFDYFMMSRARGTIVYDEARRKTVVRGRAGVFLPNSGVVWRSCCWSACWPLAWRLSRTAAWFRSPWL